ncbi:MAG: DUF971 domain-containing protein [Leptospiraceae bacterium]|nr:DUF971 domain-containing protein [Leptospiraceae bacterium]MDW7976163.1 DUF971 domain-containing protein [Leptospiraceae bacterium]
MLLLIPSKVYFDNQFLYIQWRDGKECKFDLLNLRRYCPCAQCRGGHEIRANRITLDIKEAKLVRIKKVGRYAIGLVWEDGHDSGIYTYESLRYFCDENKEYRPPGEEDD